jgi:hypothetical protein
VFSSWNHGGLAKWLLFDPALYSQAAYFSFSAHQMHAYLRYAYLISFFDNQKDRSK